MTDENPEYKKHDKHAPKAPAAPSEQKLVARSTQTAYEQGHADGYEAGIEEGLRRAADAANGTGLPPSDPLPDAGQREPFNPDGGDAA